MADNYYSPEGARIGTAENREACASMRALEKSMMAGKILEGIATMCDHGDFSLRVDLGGFVGIIPREEVQLCRGEGGVKDIAVITRVGRPVCFKILSISGNKIILSRRAAQEECEARYLAALTAGDIIPARVTHTEPFGAFVDIGCGIVSLLSVDCISVSRISHPRERFETGEKIMAVVRSIDRESGRIYVSHRELLGTWEQNAREFRVGQTVAGVVRSIESYGIFVELAPNLAGLAEVKPGITVGQTCAVYIKNIIPERMKIKLVLIDTYRGELPPAERKYYIDTETVRHIDRWLYSPPSSSKVVETVFE